MKTKFVFNGVKWFAAIGMTAVVSGNFPAHAADAAATNEVIVQAPYTNNAIVPVTWLERDSYNWDQRHAAVLEVQKTLDPEIVLIGDSITHFWGGPPIVGQQRGTNAWAATFGDHRVLNMGFGWDRTQNVLWRLDHGEMDGTHPKVVVLNIGSNNFSGTRHARANTPAEVAEAIVAICDRVHQKSPSSRIIVMGVFPRGFQPGDYYRTRITALNKILAQQLSDKPLINFLDISDQIVPKGAVISRDVLSDGIHPTEAGYTIWGKALLAAGIFQ
jgi:lysophospholipase L1-like esterase